MCIVSCLHRAPGELKITSPTPCHMSSSSQAWKTSTIYHLLHSLVINNSPIKNTGHRQAMIQRYRVGVPCLEYVPPTSNGIFAKFYGNGHVQEGAHRFTLPRTWQSLTGTLYLCPRWSLLCAS